jgi:hypothetical protein
MPDADWVKAAAVANKGRSLGGASKMLMYSNPHYSGGLSSSDIQIDLNLMRKMVCSLRSCISNCFLFNVLLLSRRTPFHHSAILTTTCHSGASLSGLLEQAQEQQLRNSTQMSAAQDTVEKFARNFDQKASVNPRSASTASRLAAANNSANGDDNSLGPTVMESYCLSTRPLFICLLCALPIESFVPCNCGLTGCNFRLCY